MTENQFKIMQSVGVVIIYFIMWNYDFSTIAKCLLELLIVFIITLNRTMKYIKQWNTKKCIENKKEFVLDILFAIFLFFALILPILL